MKTAPVSFPELILIAGTRVALGVGIGLLLSEKLPRDVRRGAGFALLGVGALTTIPLAIEVLGKLRDGSVTE
jgi:hypothetical protein